MTAQLLSTLCMTAPDPCEVLHGEAGALGYTCHMAAMHWAFMAIGKTGTEANALVGEFSLSTCSRCTEGSGQHATLDPKAYGKALCKTAQRIPSRDQLADMVEAGDILITDGKPWPAHTMVVATAVRLKPTAHRMFPIKKSDKPTDCVMIRGLNNTGTLGTGVHGRYDPFSHDITEDKFWRNPDSGKFGRAGVDLLVVKYNDFMTAIRGLSKRMLG